MIATQQIEKIITLVLATGYLKEEVPSSLLIASEVGLGKSQLVLQFDENNGVVVINDATAWGLVNTYLPKLLDGKIKHFIFPEFLFPLSKKQETVRSLVSFLNELMEEGAQEVQTFAMQMQLPRRVNAGVIACLTKDELEWRKNYWNSTGFLSRFIPLSYNYSTDIRDQILESVFCGMDSKSKYSITPEPKEVVISEKIARKTLPLAQEAIKGLHLAKDMSEIRMVKHLMKILKASALVDNREEVNMVDFDTLEELSGYMNFNYTEIE